MHCSVCFTTSGSLHTLLLSVSPAGRGGGSSSAGFRQGCLWLLHFDHARWPHAFVPGDERGVRRGVQGVCWWSPTQQWRAPICFVLSQHSILQVSQTGAWPLNPQPPPPFLHTHTTKAACLLLVHCYAKEFFLESFSGCTLRTGFNPCKSDKEQKHSCAYLLFYIVAISLSLGIKERFSLFLVYIICKVTPVSKNAQPDSCSHHLFIHVWPA